MKDLSNITLEMDSISPKGRELVGEIPPEALLEMAEARTLPVEPVAVKLALRREKGRLHAGGWVRGKVWLACSRCLEPFVTTLELEIDRFYVAHEPLVLEGGEYEMQDDTVCLHDGIFSPLRLVEEELILALPMLPLCRFNCAGLCPGCGADLNRETCQCAQTASDNPFAVLRALKKEG